MTGGRRLRPVQNTDTHSDSPIRIKYATSSTNHIDLRFLHTCINSILSVPKYKLCKTCRERKSISWFCLRQVFDRYRWICVRFSLPSWSRHYGCDLRQQIRKPQTSHSANQKVPYVHSFLASCWRSCTFPKAFSVQSVKPCWLCCNCTLLSSQPYLIIAWGCAKKLPRSMKIKGPCLYSHPFNKHLSN